jgi:DNA-binding transcriptional ArsR family regulator
VLDNPEFRNGLMKKGWFRTYVWLGRYIVRAEMKNDPHHLYQRYYQQGLLASCVPTRVVATALKIGKSTVSDHIKTLADDGIIETTTIHANESFDGQRYVVCIFGTHKDRKERWFIQDRFKVSANPSVVA